MPTRPKRSHALSTPAPKGPRLIEEGAIASIASGTELPLNVMLTPGLPPVPKLRELGVRRLSIAARLAELAYSTARANARTLLETGDYGALLDPPLTYPEVNALFPALG